MNRYSWWQYALIVVLIILGVLYAMPNFYGSNPAIQIAMKNAAPMSASFSSDVRQKLKQQNLPVINVERHGASVLIRFQDVAEQLKALDFWTL